MKLNWIPNFRIQTKESQKWKNNKKAEPIYGFCCSKNGI